MGLKYSTNVKIHVTYIPKGNNISYKIVGTDGKSIIVKGNTGGYVRSGRSHKSWAYPTYAIEDATKATQRRGYEVRIKEVHAEISQKYQLDNLIHYAKLSDPIITVVSDTRRKKSTRTTSPSELKKKLSKVQSDLRFEIPADAKPKSYKPLNIRGVKYTHYATASGKFAADFEKKDLQAKGFLVLVRKMGNRYHVYRGPKRKK